MTHAARTDSRIGRLAILAGAALALAAQVVAPVGVPLYDGVPVVEPYRWLHPGAGQAGNPTSGQLTKPAAGASSPVLVAATTETQPQAQLVTQRGAYVVPDGTTEIRVSITPIEPPPNPSDSAVVGNVYRFEVTDQSGKPLEGKPCSSCRTLVLRGPENAPPSSIRRFAGGVWTEIETQHTLGAYQANIDEVGDFALVVSGGVIGPGSDMTLIVLGGGLVIVLLAIGALLVLRKDAPPATEPPSPGRIPSKRKGGRRPPSGRSDR